MIYGYARVSTKGQAEHGNSLESQVKQLEEAGAEKVFCDSYTGTKIDRPEFDKLKNILTDGDKLIVTKLDRFARSTTQGIQLIDSLIEKGVTVNILNLGVMDNTPTGKLIRTIFLAFAEFERDVIMERTQDGKAEARRKGIRVDGRPYKEVPDFEKFLKKQKDGELSVVECCKTLDISRSKWYSLAREYQQ